VGYAGFLSSKIVLGSFLCCWILYLGRVTEACWPDGLIHINLVNGGS
jgi:hypothetical protein